MNIIEFNKRFPTSEACLDFIVKALDLRCCHKIHKIKSRMAYACSCGDHIYPTKGTIFYNSKVPLVKWFFAIYLHSQSKHGISSKELQRHLGVTYPTAYYVNQKIRMAMKQPGRLSGDIEIDETYIGGKKKGKRGRGASGKTPILGLVERGGRARLFVTKNVRAKTLEKIIKKTVTNSSVLFTDELNSYRNLHKTHAHRVINHTSKLYVDGEVHTNTIEGVWSILKRSIGGTYVKVSKDKLQQYADQFVFIYNSRLLMQHPFNNLIEKAIHFKKNLL